MKTRAENLTLFGNFGDMEKRKRWQFWVIVFVALITLYNILPTIFFYAQPLSEPIGAKRAEQVAEEIADRVNGLKDQSKAWLASFGRHLRAEPTTIEPLPHDPRLFKLTFATPQQAAIMGRYLPQASSHIPFVPAQLTLIAGQEQQPNELYVLRNVGAEIKPDQVSQLFRFSEKLNDEGHPAPLWQKVVEDRVAMLALALGGPSRTASQMMMLNEHRNDSNYDDMTISLAKEISDTAALFQQEPLLFNRWVNHLAQGEQVSADTLISASIASMEPLKTRLVARKELISKEINAQIEKGDLASPQQREQLMLLDNQIAALTNALKFIQQNRALLIKAPQALTDHQVDQIITSSSANIDWTDPQQIISLEGRHPFISSLLIDWDSYKVSIKFFEEVNVLRDGAASTEKKGLLRDKVNQLLFNDIARASTISSEKVIADGNDFIVKLNSLNESQSFLAMDLGQIAKMRSDELVEQLKQGWQRKSVDLNSQQYPVYNFSEWSVLPKAQQRLGVVVYAPAAEEGSAPEGFSNDSLYLILRGYDAVAQKYSENPKAEGAAEFKSDIERLRSLLNNYGFVGYEGSSFGVDSRFKGDYIYRLDDYYNNLLAATREQFSVKGRKRFAVLDFTDVEQRILTRNKIWDKEQEDLLKWKEEYDSSQVDLDKSKRNLVPPPTKNVYWQNFLISFAKYFKGDERKVLKWGLDLSGGKTVRIGLRDANNKPVTRPDDLNQAVNELYTRVNKMGVSERTIRVENSNIILEFPGSQGLSATELVKASAMYFHIVNEKFTPSNPTIGSSVNAFLQEVWNEAVVTNRRDVQSINEIARKQLGQDLADDFNVQPRSDYAKTLVEAGLLLSNRDSEASSNFDDTLSRIGVLRGEDPSQWYGYSHPLMVIFNNYALEGASLTGINVGWDQNEGNVLNFQVKSSYDRSRGGSPRDEFYAWTSQFSQDRIAGTPKDTYSQGRGWRMAVELNGEVITMPALRAALRDGGSISGRFTQREINQLAADLKAGSLSFTPRILSEQNISPELGKEERSRGIFASLMALVLVVVAMVGYYRFGGLIASCAVLFNILIMWGVLQNLDAALTLPGIAGIVLTIGMAVDANVLVFERVREEFKISGRIATAIAAGYRKAFSAIVDSNVTTIIAALILIQFDAGPIKGFAITLIIGIVSSMFTALFLTRYFFAGWVKNPKNKELKMAELIYGTKIDFLSQVRIAIIASAVFIFAGGALFISQYRTIFGMDFTGGYSLTVELQEKNGQHDFNYRLATTNALLDAGATSNDLQVRQLSYPQQLRIQLGTGMEEKGHPFYQMPQDLEGAFSYPYQSNPRLNWIVDALAKADLEIPESQLQSLDKSWTVMSGQFSDTMRNNAIIALLLALVSILVYITLRFEFKYAISSVIALAHDLLITLGVIALLHKLGVTIQIDLQVIGAIMTIIGYSLNDTIIVFDRIREDVKLMKRSPFTDVINHAINVTLGRTLMTSGTTLLVLLTLVLFGGQSIFGFALVMTIGVVVGTLSSLYIAPAALLYFHEREKRIAEEGTKRLTS